MWARLRARRGRRRDRRSQRALRADPCSSASSSSTRSTTRRSSRRRASATTRATWRSSARTASAACACSAAPRRRSRPSSSRAPARRRSSCSPIARARRRCRASTIVDLRAHRPGPHRRQAHQPAPAPRDRGDARRQGADDPLPQSSRLRAERPVRGLRRARVVPELHGRAHVPQEEGWRHALPLVRLRVAAARPAARSATRTASRSRGSAPRSSRRRSPPPSRRRAIARLDRDVASGKQIEKVLDRVRSREVDILVGTQMVTKGHDLPHVTLVGVINADAALSIPDFRAERARVPAARPGRRARGPRRHARAASSSRRTTPITTRSSSPRSTT